MPRYPALSALLALLWLTACTDLAVVHVDGEDRRPRGIDGRTEAALHANNKLLELYRPEWQFNRDQSAPPRLCLAMSGGGMRSAVYNIGVLKALYDSGELRQLDIMSSVSGGGYALSWFYLQQYNATTKYQKAVGPDELFAENGQHQRYLSEHSNLFLYRNGREWGDSAGKILVWALSAPLHGVANGIFDWRINLNPFRRGYENGIERVFHLIPDPDNGATLNRSINRGWFGLGSTVEGLSKAEIPALQKFIRENKLPYFIINTTAAIDDDGWHYNSELSKSVFEFTPLHYGSDAFGYHEKDFPVDFSRAVSISGAAYDSTTLPGSRRQAAFSLLNGDLGYHIANPRSKVSGWAYALPFPFYTLVHNVHDNDGPSIYLSDGGHSDNLAAYSLVRRLCEKIIIVDAEHDPEYKFEGLRKLQRRLSAELGVAFDLPGADSRRCPCPVLQGSIGPFPVALDEAVMSRRIEVVYLKLALDKQGFEDPDFPSTVRQYSEKHAAPKVGALGQIEYPFPQQSTSDLVYSKEQYEAYRDLGYYNTMQYSLRRDCPVRDGAQEAKTSSTVLGLGKH